MAAFSALSFLTDAFSRLAFDFGLIDDTSGDSSRHSYELYLEKEKKRKIKKAQEQIIALKLEEQENLLLRRQIEALREKQNTRQLQAIVRREKEIQRELLALVKSLRRLEEQLEKLRQEEEFIVLMLA